MDGEFLLNTFSETIHFFTQSFELMVYHGGVILRACLVLFLKLFSVLENRKNKKNLENMVTNFFFF